MNGKEIMALGFPQGPVIGEILSLAKSGTVPPEVLRDDLKRLQAAPQEFLGHPVYGGIALRLAGPVPEQYEFRSAAEADRLVKVWGREGIDSATLDQMRAAVELPIAVGGALMPDGHLGYGLPIGGVLATEGAVSPYAVGMDIACRMRLSVLPTPADRGKHSTLDKKRNKFCAVVEESTRFGVGGGYEQKERKQHPVMDLDWSVTEITAALKNLAWEQLGTSGSGNHFCDLGEIEFAEDFVRDGKVVVPAGCYVAILTHSGSRGPGGKVATYYSSLAIEKRNLPQGYRHLSWLNMNEEGEEYWAAMELMGRFAAANHEIIHREICARLGLEPLTVVENHHNFAWREKPGGRYGDKEVIVHRKGATPAMPGVLGVIPGTMASPAYLVEGTAGPLDVKVDSLWSASHGAGRAMSRTKTKQRFHWSEVNGLLRERGVHLMSAGLDEVPGGYKKIEKVMEAQKELVDIRAIFYPRIVKMSGEDTSED